MDFKKVLKNLVFLIIFVLGAVTIANASSGGGEESTWTPWLLLWRVINTLALVVVLVYFVKKPLVTFFAERKDQIRRDLAEALEQRETALRLLADYKEKIAGMEKELERMRIELKKAAESDSEKIMANAERLSIAVVESAKMTAEQEVRKARENLKNEAVELAVQMAETMIREKISEKDRKRIVEDYLVKVGGMK
ncbi:MAG: ATP synthase F0 subunit B [Deltaproteobacteria bacterium]|nr:ATP synthase F0 subunit B [Deltaproteobacteria bacterium]